MKFKVFIRTNGIPFYPKDEILEHTTENEYNMPTQLLHVPIIIDGTDKGLHTFELVGLADGAPYYMYVGRRRKI
jgi:hypothetical protein